MADFGYLSDTDDSAVEDLISQAKDLSVLEQVSAINCSGFTDSVLPSELEQRFRKLKSFPATNAKPKSSGEKSLQRSKSELNDSRGECEQEQSRDGKLGLEKKSELGYDSSPLNSCDSSTENEIFSESKQNPDGKYFKEKSKRGSDSAPFSSKSKSKSKSFSSPLSSTNSSRGSPSPPRKSGCFWCSPKKIIQPKSKEDRSVISKNDELLSDLGIFSVKEQQKMLKKAMKEEEKVSREAEKIVKWAKQASMRMSAHDIEDELSDD